MAIFISELATGSTQSGSRSQIASRKERLPNALDALVITGWPKPRREPSCAAPIQLSGRLARRIRRLLTALLLPALLLATLLLTALLLSALLLPALLLPALLLTRLLLRQLL
jgi:hypothetical protein